MYKRVKQETKTWASENKLLKVVYTQLENRNFIWSQKY